MGELSCARTPTDKNAVTNRAARVEQRTDELVMVGFRLSHSMCVFHSAILANRNPFAGSQEFFVADLFFLAGLQAFGRSLVRSGHGAVANDIGLGFFVAVLREDRLTEQQ